MLSEDPNSQINVFFGLVWSITDSINMVERPRGQLNKFQYLRGNLKKKRVYLKTLSIQVGGWSRPFQNYFNELIFDIRWGLSPY